MPTPQPTATPLPGLTHTLILPSVLSGCGYEVDGHMAPATKYYLFSGQRVAMRQDCNGAVVYLYHDHLGSTVATSDGQSTRYWPYGAARTGEVDTPYRYTGQRADSYTNLYQMGSRWYDGELGRWIQPDTVVPDLANPQSLNRYSYVYNRPIVAVDKDGHIAWLVTGLVGAAGGATFSVVQQVLSGISHGLTVDEALRQIDGRKVATAALVGGVAGLTMGAGTALLGTGMLATGISGAAAGIVGGQTESLANAAWGEYDRWRVSMCTRNGSSDVHPNWSTMRVGATQFPARE